MNVTYQRDGDRLSKSVVTDNQEATISGVRPYRVVRLTHDDGKVANDGTDTETISAEIVDGLEIARGTAPADAPTLPESGGLTLSIDGAEVSVQIDSGTGSKDVTTTKTAGVTIDAEAVSYDGGPIETDAVSIEVTSA